jgi:hypothetical protein
MKQSENSLTIHLYRKDEVLASLRWAIITHNYTEAAFWGLELYDSNMEEDTVRFLRSLWITQIGFGSWSALESLETAAVLSREEWVKLLIYWTRIRIHDTTILHLLIRGATVSSDWVPTFPHAKEYTTVTDIFDDCLRRGKTLDAWLISRAMDSHEVWHCLKTMALERGVSPWLIVLDESDMPEHERCAVGIVLITLNKAAWKTANEPLDMRELPSELTKAIDEWDAEESMRKRRHFKIRPEALLCITDRSSLSSSESSESDIVNDLERSLRDSSYWAQALLPYTRSDGTWISDSKKEAFYDLYFSDDIPDEWSAQDREKSHGRGLGKSPALAQQRFLDVTLQRSQILGVWNPVDCKVELTGKDTYSILRPACSSTLASALPMKPVKKQFELN